jgi:hypothetical protein
MKRLLAALGALFVLMVAAPAFAAPVTVCDLTGQHCLIPNADGSINTSGGGGASVGYVGPPPTAQVTVSGGVYNAATGTWTPSAANQTLIIDRGPTASGGISILAPGGVTLGWNLFSSDLPTSGFSVNEITASSNLGNSPTSTGVNAAGIAEYKVNPVGRYFEIQIGIYNAGTSLVINLYPFPFPEKVVGSTLLSGNNVIGSLTEYSGNTESTIPIGASASFTSTARTTTTVAFANYFQCRAYSDQAGTLVAQESHDSGATWTPGTAAIVIAAAGPAAMARVTMTGGFGSVQQYRCMETNGAVAQTVNVLTSSFTSN